MINPLHFQFSFLYRHYVLSPIAISPSPFTKKNTIITLTPPSLYSSVRISSQKQKQKSSHSPSTLNDYPKTGDDNGVYIYKPSTNPIFVKTRKERKKTKACQNQGHKTPDMMRREN